MKKVVIFAMCAFFAATMLNATGLMAQSQQPIQTATVISTPTVTLHDWAESPREARYAFLLGFVSMLEIERAWQGPNPVSASQSVVPGWARGLTNVTLQQMDDTLMMYAHEFPAQGQRSVIEVLGRAYVWPKMSQKERNLAARRYETLRPTFRIR